GDPVQEHELLDELVQRWAYPMQSIAGIEEVEPGVWHVQGGTVTPGVVRVGPLWLGRGSAGAVAGRKCIVGPTWFPDSEPIGRKSGIMKIGIREIEEIEIWDEPSQQEPLAPPRRGYVVMKRLFDVVGSSLALLVFLPLMLAIGLMILIEDGWPVLYGQRRQGKNGRVFKCWKFRTMVRNAHLMAKQLKQNDGPQIYIPNDPRVLKSGRILRKLHLDELPQFWNVLVGQMSLVGPRPSPDDENQFCPAWRDSRLSVRPGITGLWQLKRKRQQGEDFQEWIKYDMEYVQRASMRFDLEILIRTALMMVLGRKDSIVSERQD
ncbi:MAG TPA: sugar transferase, partial [Phycisphaerales bacterium]|nr:sugar transferase [Phycisphaerales bacterium]